MAQTTAFVTSRQSMKIVRWHAAASRCTKQPHIAHNGMLTSRRRDLSRTPCSVCTFIEPNAQLDDVARRIPANTSNVGGEHASTRDLRTDASSTELYMQYPFTPLARVHQGFASVKGYLKSENQDRIVAQHHGASGSSGGGFPAPPGRTQASLHPRGGAAVSAAAAGSSPSSSAAAAASAVVYSAVFDGHGGSNASTHAAKRLADIVASEQALWETIGTCSSGSSISSCDLAQEEQLQHMWHRAFSRLDQEILEESRASGHVDGTTALAGVHAGLFLFVANAGDSRAVLGRKGEAVRLTRDHRPDVQSERRRIEAEGGEVRHVKGTWRVLLPFVNSPQVKISATSRGLGDLDFKEQRLITCEPEVTSRMLLPNVDDFSIFASDGVWNFVEDQDAVDAVQAVLQQFSKMSRPVNIKAAAEAAARRLVKLAQDSGSVDDISVIVNVYDWPVVT